MARTRTRSTSEVAAELQEFTQAVYGDRPDPEGTEAFAEEVYGAEDGDGYSSPEEHFERFAKECRRLIRDRYDNLIVIDGTPGVGKSCLGLSLAQAIDPNFSLELCAYSSQDVRSLYRRAKPGDVVLYDEAVLGLLSQGGHRDPELRSMIQMLSIIRVKRVTMILCLPSIQLLDAFVKGGRARFWLNVYTRGLAKPHRVWRRARYRTSLSRMPYDEYADLNPIGYASLARTRLWKDYERQKMERVDRWLKETELDPEGRIVECPNCGLRGWKSRILLHKCPAAPDSEPTEENGDSGGNGTSRGVKGGGGAPSPEYRCLRCARSFDNAHNLSAHRCKPGGG